MTGRRITVGLTAPADDAEVLLRELTRLGTTDVVCRALRWAALMEQAIADGGSVEIVDKDGRRREVFAL
jgi:hypothetical protein